MGSARVLFVLGSGALVACGLESSGPLGDAGAETSLEDRVVTSDANNGCTCVPPAPQGWRYVALRVDGVDDCPTGYGNKTAVVEGTAPDATCACGCAKATDGACLASQVSVTQASDASCTQNATNGSTSNQASLGCFQLTVDGPNVANVYVKGTAVTSVKTPGTCNASPTATLPPVPDPHSDVLCSPNTTPSTCANGDACVTTPSAPFAVCIESDTGPCPAGYSQLHAVGVGRNDTRSCTGTCTCTPTTACAAKATSESDGNCNTSNNFTFDLDGTCKSSMMNNLHTHSLSVTTTATTTCAAAGVATPTGSSTLAQPKVVCCR